MTEDVCQRFVDFDQWSTRDAVEAMYEGQLMAMAAVKPAMRDIALAADQAAQRLGETGRLIYVGAGTSGRLAIQDGAELGPTFGWPRNRIEFCIAGGIEALTVSIEGAEDSSENGRSQIQNAKVGKNDIVIGVAASGKTPYTLGALQEANIRGAMTIGIANNPNTPLLAEVDNAILAVTGSEIIAGSTRMKAGTAQKAVLNILSTAIMTRLGHVYKGFMVDMVVSNKKLEGRAVNMICDITKCSKKTARSSLNDANENIKMAVLIALGQSSESAEQIIKQASGNLRTALALLDTKSG
ncbi:MAG: N-acetylmuramic acid 6-phosphate etherase [Robiginitomaculum sp.]|nr:MAG: N-acetylmuramic acid 6-phosphate etherase [Robiginitomaculum sp.]